MSDNLRKLHTSLSEKNEDFNVPYEQFEADMQIEDNLKNLHSSLTGKYGFNVPYDQFKADMALKKKDDAEVSEISSEGLTSKERAQLSTSPGFRTIDSEELPPVERVDETFTIDEKADLTESIKDEKSDEESAIKTVDIINKLSEGLDEKVKAAGVEYYQKRQDASKSFYSSSRDQFGSFLGTRGLSEADPSLSEDEQKAIYDDLKASEVKYNSLKNAQEIVSQAKKYYDTKDAGILEAMFKSKLAKDFFSMGLNEIGRSFDILAISRKPEEERTEEENIALAAYGLSEELKSKTDQSVSSIVGSGITETIPFMVNFALTGGYSTAAKVGVTNSLKALAKKTTNSLAKKAITKLTPVAGVVTKAAVQTPMLAELYKSIPERMIAGEEAPEAIAKSVATTFTTALTEQFGGTIAKGLNKVTNKIPNLPITNRITNKYVKNVATATGFNGWLPEFGEELIEAYGHPAITGDQKLSDVWDNKQMLGIFLTTGIISGSFSAANLVASGTMDERMEATQSLREAENNIQPETKKEIDTILKGDDVEANAEQLDQYIRTKATNRDEAERIINYTAQKVRMDAMNEAQSEIEAQEEPLKEEEVKEVKKEEKPLEDAKKEEIVEEVKEPKVEPKKEEDGKEVQRQEAEVDEGIREEVAKEEKGIREEEVLERKSKVQKKDLTLSEKRPTEKSLKKILKANENAVTRDIQEKGEKVGEVTLEEDESAWNVKRVDVEKDQRRRGIAKSVYIDLNEQAKKEGKVLQSDKPGKINNESKRIWESLVKSGDAVKLEDGSYTFKVEEDAKEIESGALRQERVEEKVEEVSDKDLPEIDRTKLQDGKKGQEEVVPPTPPSEIDTEAEMTSSGDFPVGVTNSYTNAARRARGKDPILKEARSTNKELFKGVDDKINSGQIEPRILVREIYEEDSPAVSEERQAVILHDRVRIANERAIVKSDIEKAIEAGDVQTEAALYQRLAELDVEQEINDIANTKMGTTWGRAGQFRQRVANEDYSLSAIKRDAKILNRGERISTAQEKKFEELYDKYENLQKEKIELDKKLEEKEATRESELEEERSRIEQELIQKMQSKAYKPPKDIKKRGKEIANKIRSAKLKNQDFAFATIVPPQIIDGAIEVVALSVEAGANIADAINKGMINVKKSDWYKNLTVDNKKKFKKRFEEHIKGSLVVEDPKTNQGEYDSLIVKLIEKADGNFHQGLSSILNDIAYNRVKAGKKTIDEIVDDIHNSIKDEIPGVDQRQIRDGISGYGKFRKLSKNEVDVEVRELKRQGRLDSAIEDVEKNKLPLRSGIERDVKSRETREKERRLSQEIKEKNLVPEPTEQEIADKWKSSEEAYTRRLENAIEDVQKEIDTGIKRVKKEGKKHDSPEVLRLLSELETLKKLRDEMFNIPPKTPEQKRRDTIERLTKKAIDEINSDIHALVLGNIPPGKSFSVTTKEGKEQFGFKRGVREPISDTSIDELKDLRDSLKRELSDMMPESLKEEARLDKYRKQRELRLSQLEEIQKKKDYAPKAPRKHPVLDKESMEVNRKIEKARESIEKEKEKIRLANRTKIEKIKDIGLDTWNLSKVMMASVDLSAPLRQGVVMTSKPKQFFSAFRDMFRHAFSKEYHENWLRDLKNTDIYYEMKENGLYISEPTAKLAAKEEQFMSNFIQYLEKIPGYGQLLAGSERAYVGFLNKLRADVYADFKNKIEKEGFTGEEAQNELKNYANFINHATGRGKLGVLEPIAPVLNGAFFSPRLISARLNTFNPMFYTKMSKRARREAIGNMMGFVGTAMLVLSLYEIANQDDDQRYVEWDPRSSDFFKMISKGKRYDIMGGYSQVARSLVQSITGQRKSTKSGDVSRLTKDVFPYQTRLSVLWNFFKYKLSPSASLLYGIIDDFTSPIGEDITLKKTVVEKTVPLYLQDMAEMIQEEGLAEGLVSGIPALFGVGVQYYGGEKQIEEREIGDLKRDIRRKKQEIRRLNRKLDDGDYNVLIEIIDAESDLREMEFELNIKK
jgi:hypothetical protein